MVNNIPNIYWTFLLSLYKAFEGCNFEVYFATNILLLQLLNLVKYYEHGNCLYIYM